MVIKPIVHDEEEAQDQFNDYIEGAYPDGLNYHVSILVIVNHMTTQNIFQSLICYNLYLKNAFGLCTTFTNRSS